jgi:hypothetical protein
MEKTVMIQVMGRIYVGKPVMEKAEESIDQTFIVGLIDVYEFLPIATLTNMDGKMATLSTNAMIKVGEIIQIPNEAVMAELSGDSPYYKDYVKATTGITPVKPDDIFKRNKML